MSQGKWLDIAKYSIYRNKSISTIRRYIRSNTVQFKKIDGKYFIYAPNFDGGNKNLETEKEIFKMRLENDEYKRQLKSLYEENEELKMLVRMLENTNENNSLTL